MISLYCVDPDSRLKKIHSFGAPAHVDVLQAVCFASQKNDSLIVYTRDCRLLVVSFKEETDKSTSEGEFPINQQVLYRSNFSQYYGPSTFPSGELIECPADKISTTFEPKILSCNKLSFSFVVRGKAHIVWLEDDSKLKFDEKVMNMSTSGQSTKSSTTFLSEEIIDAIVWDEHQYLFCFLLRVILKYIILAYLKILD